MQDESASSSGPGQSGFRGFDLLLGLVVGAVVLAASIVVVLNSGLWWQGEVGRWVCLAGFVLPPLLVVAAMVLTIAVRRPWFSAGLAIATAAWVIGMAWSFVSMLQQSGAW